MSEAPIAEHASTPAVDRGRVVRMFGLTIDALTMEQTVDRIRALIDHGGVHQHIAINVDKVVKAHRDPVLQAIINSCDVVNADGQPIVWASRLIGRPLPTRVTGIDLMHALIADAERSRRRLYFLGARQEILDRVVERVRREHPKAVIAGARNGYWAAHSADDVAAKIAAAKPDILFVAIPSPAKERFLDRWKYTMGVPFVMGVGGSFDVYAGVVPRAPRICQVLGIEWLFRLLQEPRRMWRRYLVEDLVFVPIVVREILDRRIRRRRSSRANGS